ncbi:unnamed protein product [Spirodela intermedia]|uniref:Histone chaperone domain-containing protein n=1 Tax=Spirodela intermedia TaxID=51605 RepID=A0A7I8J276_SPIIN|nr:unnamed protein product [Spirodela intermedia]CAA6664324.1 unnamed protein product [Spirodela intermedia]
MEAEEGSKVGEGGSRRGYSAIRARVRDFKEQADSITLENVRRTIEKDLGMGAFTLDVHKRFIKQSLEKCFDVAEEEAISKDSEENLSIEPGNQKLLTKSDGNSQTEEENDSASTDDKKVEEISTVSNGTDGHGTDEPPRTKIKIGLSEATIKTAIKKRASYLRANSEKLSLIGVRRLLEEDLKLEKNTLDPYKKFISRQLDGVLEPPATVKPVTVGKKRSEKGTPSPRIKRSKRASRSEDLEDLSGSDTYRSEDEEIDDRKEKSKRRSSRMSGELQLQKSRKNLQGYNQLWEKSSDTEDGNDSLKDAELHPSDEETVKHKKETPTRTSGKKVEHLKAIIKSCGIGVPPSVYKRVKQAPENKRESYLIKELEDILRKESLSTNPSEKEIKAVRKKKERAKELEGIDLSNIVSSTRRRSTSSFAIPPKPELPAESDEDEEEENEEGDEEEGDEDEEDEVSDEENNDNGDEESD